MLSRPTSRAFDITHLDDARQKSLDFRESADHALISARAGSYVIQALASLRRYRPLNANRSRYGGRTTPSRAIGRRHRQRVCGGYGIHRITRAGPSRRSVELLNTGAARACASVRGKLIGQEACSARWRTHTSRAIHGRRGVGKPGKWNRHHIGTRRSHIARLPEPEQARSKPTTRRGGRTNSGASSGSTTGVLPGILAKRRIVGAWIRSATTDESKDEEQRERSHRVEGHSLQQNVNEWLGCTEPTSSPPLGLHEPDV
jgi:hypothetical protein